MRDSFHGAALGSVGAAPGSVQGGPGWAPREASARRVDRSPGAPGALGLMGALGAMVLVGGRARRMGGAAKPLVALGGSTPWRRTLIALEEHGIGPVVAVGPPFDGAEDPSAVDPGSARGSATDPGSASHSASAPGSAIRSTTRVTWVQEDPPFGGPVAAVAAGLPALAEAEWMLLLAGDLVHPAEVVRTLHDAVRAAADAGGGQGAADHGLVDAIVLRADDHPQWLAGAYRVAAVRAALAAIAEPSGAAARQLLGGLPTRWIPDQDGITADIDTPADLERARAALAGSSGGHDTDPSARHEEETS